MRGLWTWVGFALLVSACDKPSSSTSTNPATAATPAASPATTVAGSTPSGSAGALPPASATGSAAAAGSAAPGDATYAGSFKSKVGVVTTPKDAHIKVWGNDPGTDMLGDGTITLHVTGAGDRRTITGEAKGTFGDLLVAGELDGKSVQARVDPKTPNAPNAMTGVLQGTLEGGAIVGTLRVANRSANIVREADVKLTPAP